MSEYEGDQDDVVGYISIKDYAYDESNPLHFGYFEEDEEDQSNLRLANTKSVLLPDEYVVNRKAVAIYPFAPENDNELELKEGDVVYISYKPVSYTHLDSSNSYAIGNSSYDKIPPCFLVWSSFSSSKFCFKTL